MSEATIKFDDGVTFETRSGVKFRVPVISLGRELRELADKAREEGLTHQSYLGRVAEVVKQKFDVELSLDEADWFKDNLELAWAKKKQSDAENFRNTLNSVYSMGSTASA